MNRRRKRFQHSQLSKKQKNKQKKRKERKSATCGRLSLTYHSQNVQSGVCGLTAAQRLNGNLSTLWNNAFVPKLLLEKKI